MKLFLCLALVAFAMAMDIPDHGIFPVPDPYQPVNLTDPAEKSALVTILTRDIIPQLNAYLNTTSFLEIRHLRNIKSAYRQVLFPWIVKYLVNISTWTNYKMLYCYTLQFSGEVIFQLNETSVQETRPCFY